jgi:hypothetical protein
VDRPHPIQIITLLLVALAVIFSFVAMRTAFEARDHAASAAAQSSVDNGYEILQLQEALVRAGVIDDPWVVPDDHLTLGGPWAECLTTEERVQLASSSAEDAAPSGDDAGPSGDDAPASEPCGTLEVEPRPCPAAAPNPPEAEQDEPVDDAVDEACEIVYRIDGRPHHLSGRVHPDEVQNRADTWFTVEGAVDVDRVARGPEGDLYLHVIDHVGDASRGEFGLEPGWWTAFE